MSLKDLQPTELEITQMFIEKKAADQMARLQSAEESLMKSIKDIADKFEKLIKERKIYQEIQFEISRNYIQLTNQKSTIVQAQQVNGLKEHVKNMQDRTIIEDKLLVNFRGLADSYKEYVDNMKECTKIWNILYKSEAEWYNASMDFRKAQDKYETSKLEKLEIAFPKLKAEVEKQCIEKTHRMEFVKKSMVRVNQSWQKLKIDINNMNW